MLSENDERTALDLVAGDAPSEPRPSQQAHEIRQRVLEKRTALDMVAGPEPVGFGEAFSRGFKKRGKETLGFVGGPLRVIGQTVHAAKTGDPGKLPEVFGVREAISAIERAGRVSRDEASEEDIDALVEEFHYAYRAGESRGNVKFLGGAMGAEIPFFAAEIAGTGPAGGMARAGVRKAMAKTIQEGTQKVLERTAKTALTRAARAAPGEIAYTATQVSLAPRLWSQALEGVSAGITGEAMLGTLDGTADEFLKALPRELALSFAENSIEFGSERLGGPISRVTGLDRLRLFQLGVLEKWTQKAPGRTLQDGFSRVAKATEWQGVVVEIGEEAAADIARSASFLQPWDEALPTAAELAAMAVTFSVPGAAANVARAVTAPGLPKTSTDVPPESTEPGEASADVPQTEAAFPEGAPEVSSFPSEEMSDEELERATKVMQSDVEKIRSEGIETTPEFAEAQEEIEKGAGGLPELDSPGELSAEDRLYSTSPDPMSDEPVRPPGPTNLTEAIEREVEGEADRPAIIRSYENILNAAGKKPASIREGVRAHLRGKRSAGEFELKSKSVAVKKANDIAVAAHETGHGVEDLLLGKMGLYELAAKKELSPKIQAELVGLVRRHYPGGTAPPNSLLAEGFAEFFRLHLTGESDIQAEAPAVAEWFSGLISENPELQKAISDSQAQINVWKGQGALERVQQSIYRPRSVKERIRKAKDKTKAVFSYGAFRNFIDQSEIVYEAQAAASEAKGQKLHQLLAKAKKSLSDANLSESAARKIQAKIEAVEARIKKEEYLEPSERAGDILKARRLRQTSITDYMVEHHTIDRFGNPVGPSLTTVLARVKDRIEEFELYLYARRAIKLLAPPQPEMSKEMRLLLTQSGQRIPQARAPRDPGISLADATYVFEKYDSDDFSLAADGYYKWKNDTLAYVADVSPTYAKAVESILENDVGDHAPLHREYYDDLGRAMRGISTKGGSPVARLHGSGRRVKPLLETTVSNTEALIRRAHEREILESMISWADNLEGMGEYIKRVPVENTLVAKRNVADLVKQIERETGVKVTLEDAEGEIASEEVEATLDFFAPKTTAKSGDPVFHIYRDGKLQAYQVNARLYESLEGLDIYRLPKVLEMTFGKLTNLFRLGTTGLRATFGMVRNPIRDPQTMYMNSRASGNPALLFKEWLAAVGRTFIAAATGEARMDPSIDLFMRTTGKMALPLGPDTPGAARKAKHLGKRTVHTIGGNVLDWYRGMVQFAELAPRIAEQQRIAKDIDYRPGEPLDLGTFLDLSLAGAEVTTDFTAFGRVGRMLNRMVPFFNSSLQGPRALARAYQRNPARVIGRGMTLSLMTLALWWKYKDDDWYEEMPFRERFLYWYFPVDDEVMVRIPRAYEVGALFATVPEALADAWYREDPEGAKEGLQHLVETVAPPHKLQDVSGLGVLYELGANRDFFFDRPIETLAEQRRAPEERYNDYTSRVAVFFGETFGVSPKKIDHAIGGVFGGLGDDLVGLLGRGDKKTSLEASDIPVVGTLFRRGGKAGTRTQSVERLYEALESAIQTRDSLKQEETQEQRQGRLMLEDAVRAIGALSRVRASLGESTERARMTREMSALASDALQRYAAGGFPARGPVKAARKKAEFLELQAQR